MLHDNDGSIQPEHRVEPRHAEGWRDSLALELCRAEQPAKGIISLLRHLPEPDRAVELVDLNLCALL